MPVRKEVRRDSGAIPDAGEAAGAGVESPTVPPETEDGLAERRPAVATDRLTVQFPKSFKEEGRRSELGRDTQNPAQGGALGR